MNRKKIIIVLISSIFIVALFVIGKFGIEIYQKSKEAEKIKNATIEIELTEDLTASFNTEKKVSDFIKSINGKIVDDHSLDTISLGKQKVEFEFINDEDIKVPYSYEITVSDTTPPLVNLGSDYYVTTKFDGTLEEKILCADDHDDEPICTVEGTYDTSKVGTYKLNFKAADSSGNETNIPFTLHVSKPSTTSSTYNPTRLQFSDMIAKFKGENTALGIDVSSWQGDINFQKLKNAGVEFAFVRVGSRWQKNNEFFLDSKFEQNMKGFNDVGIPVGAYFYSYAKNEDEAREDAEWLIEKLECYNVDLPIAFDFEDWGRYNQYKMSLYRLNRNAQTFIETLEKAGYKGALYGSVSYLNKMWDRTDRTIWAAHYTTNANYRDYAEFWQYSAAGRVDGINGDVDLDIWYK